VHPEQPGRSVSREGFECLWRHSVLLLQRGFKTGSILTVDEDEAKKLGKPWTRRCDLHCGSTQLCWHGDLSLDDLSHSKLSPACILVLSKEFVSPACSLCPQHAFPVPSTHFCPPACSFCPVHLAQSWLS